MQEIWNIIILSSKDSDYEKEYEKFMEDVNTSPKVETSRYVVYEFDQSPEKTVAYAYIGTNSRKELTITNESNDIYNTGHLIKFFNEHVKAIDTVEVLNRYMIITWGHGAGMGVFAKKLKALVDRIKTNNLFTVNEELISSIQKNFQRLFLAANMSFDINDDHDDNKAFRQKLFQDLNTLHESSSTESADIPLISNEEIRSSLKMVTGKDLDTIFKGSVGKVDILISINCYTQMFEFGYWMKDSVRILVAPQTMIPFTGINYPALFAHIADEKKDRSIEQIAKIIADTFWVKYCNTPYETLYRTKYQDFPLKQTSFSCNKLEFYESINHTIGILGRNLEALLDIDINYLIFISQARNRTEDIAIGDNCGIIDLVSFYKNVLLELKPLPKQNAEQIKKYADARAELDKNYLDLVLEDIKTGTGLEKKLRSKTCVSMVMSQADAYIEKDRKLDKTIKFTAMSPCFLSVFFPGNGLAEMQVELQSFASTTINTMDVTKPGYADWLSFLKKYK